MNTIYVAKTDKGYIKGDIYKGVEFVDKDEARQFSLNEAHLYKDSMAQDMFDFYKCTRFQFEEL